MGEKETGAGLLSGQATAAPAAAADGGTAPRATSLPMSSGRIGAPDDDAGDAEAAINNTKSNIKEGTAVGNSTGGVGAGMSPDNAGGDDISDSAKQAPERPVKSAEAQMAGAGGGEHGIAVSDPGMPAEKPK